MLNQQTPILARFGVEQQMIMPVSLSR